MNQYYDDFIFEKNSNYANSRIVETMEINPIEYPRVILINIDNFNKFKIDKPILEFMSRDIDGHIEQKHINRYI